MRRHVRVRTGEEVARQFPLADLVPGWFFRVREVSPGCYCVEGTDLFGREVCRQSGDPDEALEQCKVDARAILDQVRPEQ